MIIQAVHFIAALCKQFCGNASTACIELPRDSALCSVHSRRLSHGEGGVHPGPVAGVPFTPDPAQQTPLEVRQLAEALLADGRGQRRRLGQVTCERRVKAAGVTLASARQVSVQAQPVVLPHVVIHQWRQTGPEADTKAELHLLLRVEAFGQAQAEGEDVDVAASERGLLQEGTGDVVVAPPGVEGHPDGHSLVDADVGH